MKRSAVNLEMIADYTNLAVAFHRAASGKTFRHEVQVFRENLDRNLEQLSHDILSGTFKFQQMRQFYIYDPKLRLIHAPVFRERVLHHAIMAHIGPILDRSLVFDTYACRVGKGTIAAVQRAQYFAGRYPWYGQIDIRAYFANIDHSILRELLRRKLKNKPLLKLLDKVIGTCGSRGAGLPIGALTSQHFANFYLAGLDRFLLEVCKVKGMVRYMDDVVWWADSKSEVRDIMSSVRQFLQEQYCLSVKEPTRSGPSHSGLKFCGFRIFPGLLLLSKRRKSRYVIARAKWEEAFISGRVNEAGLQAGYASALGLTTAAQAYAWRAEQLKRKPLASEVENV